MKFTDSLNIKDVETIAKGRVNRAESKNTNTYLMVALVIIAVGVFVLRVSVAGGFACMIAGVAVFMYYNNKISKKQAIEKQRCVAEWQKELAEKRNQTE
jgi:hypothetical protein